MTPGHTSTEREDSMSDKITEPTLCGYCAEIGKPCDDCGASGYETTMDGRTVGVCKSCNGSGAWHPAAAPESAS